MTQRLEITFPVGRIVQGSLYKARTQDAEGKPLLIKHGPDAGKPRVDFYFAVAIPKQPGHTHWAQTPEWGAKIYAAGAAAFPVLYQTPAFAWKIEDGDSQTPNRKGRKPCDQEGYPGCWIVKFSGGYAPKVYQRDAAGAYVTPATEFVKPGYFVQVAGNTAGNGAANQPGMYINHSMALFVGYGDEIVMGPDAAAAFGGGSSALPAGASLTPLGVAVMPAAAAVVPAAAAVMPPVAAVVPPPVMVPVVPNSAVLAVPVARQMTAKANSITYEQFMAAGGWTDALLVAQGYMLP